MVQVNTASVRLHRYLVISTYLTTLLACVCLVFAELSLMPEIVFFAILGAMALAVAYGLEGHWTLSLRRANVLAVLIAVFLAIWAVYQNLRPSAGLLRQIPWPTSLLPYLGPVLLMLLPAKLVQPKAAMDYWWVHLTGLASVGLGCVLADDSIFGILMLLYLLSLLWCLALFLLYREAAQTATSSSGWRLPGLRHLSGWAAPIVVLAAVVFLYTPRFGTEWNIETPGRRVETGMPEEPAIDLNKASTVEMNRDVAFEVYAETNTRAPKLDLPTDQRWRGMAFSLYEHGKWTNPKSGPELGSGPQKLPDLGPDQYLLTFHLKDKLRAPFLSDPVQFPSTGKAPPVIQILSAGEIAGFKIWPGRMLTPSRNMPPGKGRYQQVALPASEADLGPEYSDSEVAQYRAAILQPDIREWTRRVLTRLKDNGQLLPDVVDNFDQFGDFQTWNQEIIARALEHYLSASGEYHYTLELKRADPDLDPVQDFLFNTRAGHCNRFASALAVMLRSVHIPARVVLGFRGAESRGDGWYDVRQCHAHSWVEVYVNRPDADHPVKWHSLALDPSPLDEAIEAAQDAGAWWNSGNWNIGLIFKDLFINYSTERRDRFMEQLGDTATAAWKTLRRNATASGPAGARFRTALALSGGLFVLSLVLVAKWRLARRRRRRQSVTHSHLVAFHQRLLRILARRGWKQMPTQTAREFAQGVAPRLERLPGQQAEFVRRVIDQYYRVRYGREALGPEESRQIDAGLERLAAELAHSPN